MYTRNILHIRRLHRLAAFGCTTVIPSSKYGLELVDHSFLISLIYEGPIPNGVIAFAVQQLQAAEDAGQRAWIIAHMPPSSGDAFHDQVSIFQHTTTVPILGAHHVVSQIISIKSFNATKIPLRLNSMATLMS